MPMSADTRSSAAPTSSATHAPNEKPADHNLTPG
jgi:hypothetical protein